MSHNVYTNHSTTGPHLDGNSEEYILASVGADGSDQITKTTAVSVAFESRNTEKKDTVCHQEGGEMLPAFLKESRNAG